MKKLIIPALLVSCVFTGFELQARRCRSCSSCSTCSCCTSCSNGSCRSGNCSTGNCALPKKAISKTAALDAFVTTFKTTVNAQDKNNAIICAVKVALNPALILPFEKAAKELKNLAYVTDVKIETLPGDQTLVGAPVHYQVTIKLAPEVYAEFKKAHNL